MSATRSVEVTGASVEDAIESGLEELAVSRGNVIVEVLEEPSRGILGLGTREARVRLTTVARPQPTEPEVPVVESDSGDAALPITTRLLAEEELTDEARVGSTKLERLLDLLEIDARVEIEASTEDSDAEYTTVLHIQGDELGNLIGRKGETLASLQYLTRLMVSHELQRRVDFVIDAGGYKAKRSETLSKLALRMADQAVERHRTVKLEPMPPHERRIIHMALRNRTDVITESIGEGNLRKVTIIPQRD